MLPCLTSKLNLNRTIIKVIKKMFVFIKVRRHKQNVSDVSVSLCGYMDIPTLLIWTVLITLYYGSC